MSPSSCPRCPQLFRTRRPTLDAVLVNATPPDDHGFCSLGVSVEAMQAAISAARMVIVQLNRAMPRTLGESFIHVDAIDLAVEVDVPPYELPLPASLATSSGGSGSMSPASSRMAQPSSSGSGRSQPPPRSPWSTIATWGSIPRCSPTQSSTWSNGGS